MLVRKFTLIFLILALLLSLASCGDENTNRNTDQNTDSPQITNQKPEQIPKQANGPLSIYLYKYVDKPAEDAAEKFNSEGYGNIKTKIVEYDHENLLGTQLETELAAGLGPDVILSHYYDMPHLLKFVQNGSFYNMSEMLDEDGEFKPSDYNEIVTEFGFVNGSRYIMPISFKVNTVIFTTKQHLEENNITVGRYIAREDLANMADAFSKAHSGDEKHLLNMYYGSYFDKPVNLLDSAFDPNSAVTAQALDQYGRILHSVYYTPGQALVHDSMYYSLLPEGKTVLSLNSILGFDLLIDDYKSFKSEFEPVILAVSPQKGVDTTAVEPCMVASINSNCGNKKAAYEYIRLMMSEEIQKSVVIGLPVNKAAYEAQKNAFIENPEYNGVKVSKEVGEALARQIDEIVNGSLTFNFIDEQASNIIYQEANNVYSGTKTATNATESLGKGISDYLDGDINAYLQATPTPPPDTPKLTIQYMDSDSAIDNAVQAFNDERKDIRIEGSVYPAGSRDEYVNKLITSVMAGEGPDIIYYDRYMFNSLEKTMATGVFCDLNELIANDSAYKSLDLNNKVLDSGIFNGKRYYIPLRYELPLLMTTQGVLDQNGIKIDDSKWTLDEFKKIILNYAKTTGNKCFINSLFLFKLLVNGCGVDFIDYDAKQANFESKEFIDLMKFYKDIYPYITTAESDMNYNLTETMIQNHTIAMNFSFIESPERLWSDNSTYNEILGGEPVIYPLPTINPGNDIPVELMYGVSINQSCKNKQAAFDFLKMLLSEDMQRVKNNKGNYNYTIGFPVNNKALEEELRNYTDPSSAGLELSSGSGKFTSVPLSENLASRISQLAGRACAGPEIDQVVYGIINDGLRSYLDGKRTAEQAAKDINGKVDLFLNE